MKLVFFTFSDNRLALNQSDSSSSSELIIFIRLEIDELEYIRLVSSANKIKFRYVLECTISFIYSRNKSGPRIEPCGTPQLMDLKLELQLL